MYSASRIRRLIATRGVTINWVAEKTGYHPSTVTRMLNGKQPLTLAFGVKVADAFDVPPDFLQDPATQAISA
jgi:plasmid maintenance system antidote protein VapI